MTCCWIVRAWPRLWAPLALWLWLMGVAGPAYANSSVVVLGVRSIDADDELARKVSQALREAAKSVPEWKVSNREVSLVPMSLAHGCDEPDTRCMADIARTLEVDRLIYGTMVRGEGTTEISVFNFDAVTGQVESAITEKVPSSALVGASLKETAKRLAKRLSSTEATGALLVRSNTTGARVLLDDAEVGVLDAHGQLLIASVSTGQHNLQVATAERKATQSIEIKEAETTKVELMLDGGGVATGAAVKASDAGAGRARADSGASKINLRRIFAYSALGLAGAFAIATTYSWVRIHRINGDDDLNKYRDQFTTNDQVCREAARGTLRKRDASFGALEKSANSLCNEAETLEVLQWVFLGSALVAGGVGTYLLLTDVLKTRKHSLTVYPRIARGQGMLAATLRF